MEYRFIADAMLGKLAKWLRIMGCDVEYFADIPDKELAERACAEKRIILTRDTLLIRRRKVRGNYFFVEGDSYKDQIRQVVKHFSLDPFAGLLTRCLVCNVSLDKIGKMLVKNRVPQYVYETQAVFRICPLCSRIYWHATHKDAMVRQLEAMLAG